MSVLYLMTYLLDEDTFLSVDGKQVVKFGHTSNLEQRMSVYRSNMPLDVLLLATVPGGYAEEQHALSLLPEGSRHSGEWIFLDKVSHIIEGLNQEPILYPKKSFNGKPKRRIRYRKERKYSTSFTDAFMTWVAATLESNKPVNKKVFEQAMGLNQKERSSLSAQLSKKYSPIRKQLASLNIDIISKRGVGTTFTKVA